MSLLSKLSLRTRLVVTVSIAVIIGFFATVSVLTDKSSEELRLMLDKYATEVANTQGLKIAKDFDDSMGMARTMGQALTALQENKMLDRPHAEQMLKGFMEANPNVFGIWNGWDNNSFDGNDQEYKNKSGYDDTGRFAPYWFRIDGKLDRRPTQGDFFKDPRNAGTEMIAEPQSFSVGGKNTMMTSVIVPIFKEKTFIGLTAIDVTVDDIQKRISTIKPFDTGYASVISNKGYIVGDGYPENVGKMAKDIGISQEAQEAIAAGKEFKETVIDPSLDKPVLKVYVPIWVGKATTAWSFVVSIPLDNALSSIYRLRSIAVILGIISAIIVSILLAIMLQRMVINPIGGEPSFLANIINKVAKGDLTSVIRIKPKDLSSMMRGMKNMQDQLISMIDVIRMSSDSVSTASKEIAQGNMDLSGRTENQAASLEETVSALSDLTDNVKSNADNAKDAFTLSEKASTTALNSNTVVNEVVEIMSDIRNESQKMFDIISTIEGIAFQTNILALNAAVEAARAGEQGRGFAVVASEVRNLAQRSSSASKEIKELIENSLKKIGNGADHANKAGSTMHEVLTSIQILTHNLNEISSASEVQSNTLIQIRQSVSGIDDLTQKNAALVEESAAAAQSLSQEAERLLEAVSLFKTSLPVSNKH